MLPENDQNISIETNPKDGPTIIWNKNTISMIGGQRLRKYE